MANAVDVLTPERPVKQQGRIKTTGYAAHSSTSPLQPFSFERREPGPQGCTNRHPLLWRLSFRLAHRPQRVDQHYLSCRSRSRDRRSSGQSRGPGAANSKRATSPQSGAWLTPTAPAPPARRAWSSIARAPRTFTYNSEDKHLGGMTYGGYSKTIVVDEAFVLRPPANLDPAATAPLLCAGITTYSPLRHWKVQKGQKVGIVGLGGLGHMGVKLANALGAHVTLFTTSTHKTEDAKRLGAHEVVALQESGADGEARW